MYNNLKQKKAFYLVLLSLLIVICSFIYYMKPSFTLKDSRILNDYYVSRENDTYTGKLFEQDVLYFGKLTSEAMDNYVRSIKPPKDAVAVVVKFYRSYDDDAKKQPDTNLKYKIEKIL